MPYVIGGLVLGLLALVFTGGKKKGPASGYSDQALSILINAAKGGNQQAIAVLSSLNMSTNPEVQAQFQRVTAMSEGKGASGYSDAALVTFINAAKAGNPQAIAVLSSLNMSTNPEVQAQFRRVAATMGTPAASAGWGPLG